MEPSTSEVWLVLRGATLLCSVLGSGWLLRAAWRPSHLFTRQLRHLAVADLGLSMAAPGYELGAWFWFSDVPKSLSYFSQCLFRLFLCTSCIVETEIAAGVMTSALRWQRCPRILGKSLMLSWLLALVIVVAEAVVFPDMAELVALVLCTSFILSLLMYLVSILAVLWTPSPSTVVRRASWRALSFPFGFLLTVFPQWLVYTGLRDDAWFGHIATLAVYSNGWVNSAVYSWQNRRLCAGRNRSRSSMSFHVGFGRVSRLFPQTASSQALSESTQRMPWTPRLGILFEVHGEHHLELCVDRIRVEDQLLLQNHMLQMQQEDGLCCSSRPIWLDWDPDCVLEGSPVLQLEYRIGGCGHSVQLPCEPGLWLISLESAVATVSLISDCEDVISMSPSTSSSDMRRAAAVRAAEADAWAPFIS